MIQDISFIQTNVFSSHLKSFFSQQVTQQQCFYQVDTQLPWVHCRYTAKKYLTIVLLKKISCFFLVYPLSGIPTFWYSHFLVFPLSGIPTFWYSHFLVYPLPGMATFWYTHFLVYPLSGMPTFWYTHFLVYPLSVMPTFWYTHFLVWPLSGIPTFWYTHFLVCPLSGIPTFWYTHFLLCPLSGIPTSLSNSFKSKLRHIWTLSLQLPLKPRLLHILSDYIFHIIFCKIIFCYIIFCHNVFCYITLCQTQLGRIIVTPYQLILCRIELSFCVVSLASLTYFVSSYDII